MRGVSVLLLSLLGACVLGAPLGGELVREASSETLQGMLDEADYALVAFCVFNDGRYQRRTASWVLLSTVINVTMRASSLAAFSESTAFKMLFQMTTTTATLTGCWFVTCLQT